MSPKNPTSFPGTNYATYFTHTGSVPASLHGRYASNRLAPLKPSMGF